MQHLLPGLCALIVSDGTSKCSKHGANDDARVVNIHDHDYDFDGDHYCSKGAEINWVSKVSSWKVGQRLALEALNAILVCAAQRDFFNCQFTRQQTDIHRPAEQQSRWPMHIIFSGQWEPGLKLNRLSTAGSAIEPHIRKLVPLLLHILDLAAAPQHLSGTSVRSLSPFLSAPLFQSAPHEADERYGVVVAALQCLAVLLILRRGDGSPILDNLQLGTGMGTEAILLRFTDIALHHSDTSTITCQATALDSLCLGVGGLGVCYSFSDISPQLVKSASSPSDVKSSCGSRTHEGNRFLRHILLPRLIASIRDCHDEKNEHCGGESAALHVLRYVMALPVAALGGGYDDEDPMVAAALPLGVSLSELVLLAVSLVTESRQIEKQHQCWLSLRRAVRLIHTVAKILETCVYSDDSSASSLARKRATTVCGALLLDTRNRQRTHERNRRSPRSNFRNGQNNAISPPSSPLQSLSTENEATQPRYRTFGAPVVVLITSIKALASSPLMALPLRPAAHSDPNASVIKAVVDESCALLRSTVRYVAILDRVGKSDGILASSEIQLALHELFTCLLSIVRHPGGVDSNSGSGGGYKSMGLVKLLAVVVDNLPDAILRYLVSHKGGVNDLSAVLSMESSIIAEDTIPSRLSHVSPRSFLDSLLWLSLGRDKLWQSATTSPSFSPQDDEDCETAARCLCETLRKLALTPLYYCSYQEAWHLEAWVGNLLTSPQSTSEGDDFGGIFNPLRMLGLWAQASTSTCDSFSAYRCCRTFMWLARGTLSRSPPIKLAAWNKIAGQIVELLVG